MGMEKYLLNLRQELSRKMIENRWSIAQLSIICDISYHAMCNIVNGTVKDINFSTFIKICENAKIPYTKILEIKSTEIFKEELTKCILHNGENEYVIVKKGAH